MREPDLLTSKILQKLKRRKYMNIKSEKAIKSIGRSISNINKQIKIIREEYPEAGIYVENGDSFNIMKGATHTRDNANSPLHNNVIVCYNLIHSECGAW